MALLFIKTNQTKSCPAKDLILPLEILLNLTDTSCSFYLYWKQKNWEAQNVLQNVLFHNEGSPPPREEKNSQQFLIKYA